MDLLTYKCPNCSGSIVFESNGQEFKCESCDTVFTKEQLAEYDEMLRNFSQTKDGSDIENFEWQSEGDRQNLENVSTYSCQFCGAQIVTDETTAASECPYCNNPIIIAPNLSGGNRPDLIIPFKLKKEQAEEALKTFYKGKLFLPDEFKNENKIKEIKGVYIPFWLFDCSVAANITYNASKVHVWRDKSYEYTKTDRYKIFRKGSIAFQRIPADGSSKMEDRYMDAIEPFNYSELIDFNAAYLSGYLADRYDVNIKDNKPRINERIENSTVSAFRNTVVGYTGVSTSDKNIGVYNGNAKYALFPVWLLNTKYKDKIYTFAMNGQTGKLVGNLPVDKKKYWGCLLGIAAAIIAIGQFFIL